MSLLSFELIVVKEHPLIFLTKLYLSDITSVNGFTGSEKQLVFGRLSVSSSSGFVTYDLPTDLPSPPPLIHALNGVKLSLVIGDTEGHGKICMHYCCYSSIIKQVSHDCDLSQSKADAAKLEECSFFGPW
jgi:hypothetical protein